MTPEQRAKKVKAKKKIADKKLDLAIQMRTFEIELFWKRSNLFWLFMASVFVGYAALKNAKSDLAIIISCFGMVCAFAWTLVNRGSKYWQENWESKVERYEISVIGKFFAEQEKIQDFKGAWLQARQYSVSKLSIALSDYVFVLWLSVVILEMIDRFAPLLVHSCLKECGVILFVIFSIVYLRLLCLLGRSSEPPK